MTRELAAHNKPVFDQLHPNIYGAAVGLVAWFAVSAWILFDRQSDIELPLIMVSALLLMAVLVPWSLSLVWKKYQWPRMGQQASRHARGHRHVAAACSRGLWPYGARRRLPDLRRRGSLEVAGARKAQAEMIRLLQSSLRQCEEVFATLVSVKLRIEIAIERS